MDIISKRSIIDAINTISQKYGKIDALVNNAYPSNGNNVKKFEDVEYENFCQNISVYFLKSPKFTNFFNKQGFDSFINISSLY